jgi:TldD protein
MSDLSKTDGLFFERTDLDRTAVEKIVDGALKGADDGEMFLEYCQSEAVTLDDGRIRSASFDTAQGFGLRAIAGEAIGYAHASDLSKDAMERAADTVRAVHAGHGGTMAAAPAGTNRSLYTDENPLGGSAV